MVITDEHLRVFRDVRDKGCIVNWYHGYLTAYYGDGETMPRNDWHLLYQLITRAEKFAFDGYQILSFTQEECDYLTWIDVTSKYVDDAEFSGIFLEYMLKPLSLELLNK